MVAHVPIKDLTHSSAINYLIQKSRAIAVALPTMVEQVTKKVLRGMI